MHINTVGSEPSLHSSECQETVALDGRSAESVVTLIVPLFGNNRKNVCPALILLGFLILQLSHS